MDVEKVFVDLGTVIIVIIVVIYLVQTIMPSLICRTKVTEITRDAEGRIISLVERCI